MRNAAEIKEAIKLLIEADWFCYVRARSGGDKGRKKNDFAVNFGVLNPTILTRWQPW
jgi:hypothetical protein